jgi:uncharacterized protein YqeY
LESLKDKINSKLKEAMLAKDVFVRDTLRLITSEIKRFEVDNRSEKKNREIKNNRFREKRRTAKI